MVEKVMIDLAFSKSGCRKVTKRLVGPKAYCPKCHRYFTPPEIAQLRNGYFGHGFQAWIIYQRLALRMPYRSIRQAAEDQFNETISAGSIRNFMEDFSAYYSDTENVMIERMRASPFLHVDETRVNVQGADQYIWVFTEGKRVVFRLTKTREAGVVREFVTGFSGVLVTDFFAGYDSLECRQQKCLVHLIRDINQDLWDYPLDSELEWLASQFQALLSSIFASVDRYGLRKRHLRRFTAHVQQFYDVAIDRHTYQSDVALRIQKRFERYRESLFTFLEYDHVPWNNNMAERAIRHLAIQRKISGTFFESAAPHYLLLLGITQTCRFQGKSLLRFLVSGEKDVDTFRPAGAYSRGP
jgi:hypothetical protein